jgi:hypothetical protein
MRITKSHDFSEGHQHMRDKLLKIKGTALALVAGLAFTACGPAMAGEGHISSAAKSHGVESHAKTKRPGHSHAKWSAHAGDFLVPVLTRWGQKEGYDVIVEHNSDWRFGVDFSNNASFRGAVDDVLAGFASAAVPPVVIFYTNNVMTIGVR